MNKYLKLYFAPASESLAGGAVPVVPPASTPTITDVNLTAGGAKGTSANEALGVKEAKPDTGVRNPSDIFGDDQSNENVQEIIKNWGKDGRPRDDQGRYIDEGKGTSRKAKAAAKPAQKPAQTQQPASQTPKPVAQQPKPAAPQKIKIGDQEKTSEEWAAHFKDLETKAAPKTEPKGEVTQPATNDQTNAEDAQREEAFITRVSAELKPQFKISESDYDIILAGGEEGAEKFAEMMAKAAALGEMRARQFSAWQAEQMEGKLSPLSSHFQTVERTMQETQFLGDNPEIKAHAEGLETYRTLRTQIESSISDIESKIAAGTATKQEQGWHLLYADDWKQNMNRELATQVKEKLGLNEAPPPPPTPTGTQQRQHGSPVAAPAIKERPLNSDRPGAQAPVKSSTNEQSLARNFANGS